MTTDLDTLLKNLGTRFDADYNKRLSAAKNEEEERNKFSQEFGDAVARAILPVFEGAVSFSSESLIMSIVHGPASSIGLSVKVRLSPTESLEGVLRYRPDLSTREAIREIQKSGEEFKGGPITPDLLASEEVKKSVAELVRSFPSPS